VAEFDGQAAYVTSLLQSLVPDPFSRATETVLNGFYDVINEPGNVLLVSPAPGSPTLKSSHYPNGLTAGVTQGSDYIMLIYEQSCLVRLHVISDGRSIGDAQSQAMALIGVVSRAVTKQQEPVPGISVGPLEPTSVQVIGVEQGVCELQIRFSAMKWWCQ
jgi:hypothetical protein